MALYLGAVIAAHDRTVGWERAVRLGQWYRAWPVPSMVCTGCCKPLIAITIGHGHRFSRSLWASGPAVSLNRTMISVVSGHGDWRDRESPDTQKRPWLITGGVVVRGGGLGGFAHAGVS